MKGKIVFDEFHMCDIAIFSSFKMSYTINLKHDRDQCVVVPYESISTQNSLFKLRSCMPTNHKIMQRSNNLIYEVLVIQLVD